MKTTNSAAQAQGTPTPKPTTVKALLERDVCRLALPVLTAARTALKVRGWHPTGALGKETGPISLVGALAIATNTDPGQLLPEEPGVELAFDSLWISAQREARDLAGWQQRPGRTQREVLRLLEDTIDRLECGTPPPPPNILIKETLNEAAWLILEHGLCKGKPERMHPDGENKQRSPLTALFDAAVIVARHGAERVPTNSLAPTIYGYACEALDRALPWAWRGDLERWGDRRENDGESVARVLRGAADFCGLTHVWSNERPLTWVCYPGEQEGWLLTARQLRDSWQWSVCQAADGLVRASGVVGSVTMARAAAENEHLNLVAPRRSL